MRLYLYNIDRGDREMQDKNPDDHAQAVHPKQMVYIQININTSACKKRWGWLLCLTFS